MTEETLKLFSEMTIDELTTEISMRHRRLADLHNRIPEAPDIIELQSRLLGKAIKWLELRRRGLPK